jgi:hypothetical protein
MKNVLTLLVASTALTGVLGVPAFSALPVSQDAASRPGLTLAGDGAEPMPLILASDDDDNDDDDHGRRDDDDDDDEDDDDDDEDEDEDDDEDEDCDDDDDDGGCRNGARNPAPAGTVAPPQNGLFGNGAPPQVQVN